MGIEEKARKLVAQGKVRKTIDTPKRMHFEVFGDTENHSVIFNKEKREWGCDCPYSVLKRKECSHIMAAKLFK